MTLTIDLEGDAAIARGPFPMEFLKIVPELAGRKFWKGSNSCKFEATTNNIRIMNAAFKDINWRDNGHRLKYLEELEKLPTQQDTVRDVPTSYKPARPYKGHIPKVLGLCSFRRNYAFLLEVGLFKTAISVHNAGILHLAKKVNGVLVVAPSGVHTQWANEIGKDLDKSIKFHTNVWAGKKIDARLMAKKGLNFLTINIDAVRTENGYATCEEFLKLHKGQSMIIIDESHLIKTHTADRTRAAIKLGSMATYRRIATGTPMTNNLEDFFSQFFFLDPDILGQRYMTSFRARYCVLRTWGQGKNKRTEVVGIKNVEEFYRLIAPHSFRLTRLEAGAVMPLNVPRLYVTGDKVAKHYRSLRDTFLTQLDNGDIVDAKHGGVAVMRLQQILCGYLPTEDGGYEIFSDERIDILMDMVRQISGPILIWSRFVKCIERIIERLEKTYGKGSATQYFGAVKEADRERNKTNWLAGKHRFFVANPATAGTGLNLQGECTAAIYYSQSYNALERWQADGRINREGAKGRVTFFDITASGTVDVAIARAISNKDKTARLTLDDIRMAIMGHG